MTTKPPPSIPSAPAQTPPTPGGIFDLLLTFSGSKPEFAALLLTSAFSTRMLKRGAVFTWEREQSDPVIESAIPPIPPDHTPDWLKTLFASVPHPRAMSRTQILPRDFLSGHGGRPASSDGGIKPLSPGGPVYLAFEMAESRQEELPSFLMNLELIAALWRAYLERIGGNSRHGGDAEIFAPALSVLSAVNASSRFLQSAMAFCNDLASRFGCDRVSLGFLKGRYVRLVAMSHTEKIGKGMELVQAIESAMEECLDQDAEILFPESSGSTFISRAAAGLSRQFACASVISLPLRHESAAQAVVTLERASPRPPDARDVKLLRLIADLAAPRLIELQRHDRWAGARLAAWSRESLAVVLGPRHTWAKLLALACVGLIAFFSVFKSEYRVEATFVTQPVEKRVVAAPYDGFLAAVHTRPGDALEAGATLMAELETAELRAPLAMKRAEQTSHDKDAALARRDNKLAEEQVAAAKSGQAGAECALLEERLAQAAIYSPLSGVVLSGDWINRVGAPVKLGDKLFEIAPVDRMEADLYVPEEEIADVREGQTGELAAVGRPDEKIRFHVTRITPSAELIKQKNVFRVQIRLVEPPGWMLPGLEGVAKIDVAERLLIAIWSRRAVNWVKMKLWLWW